MSIIYNDVMKEQMKNAMSKILLRIPGSKARGRKK